MLQDAQFSPGQNMLFEGPTSNNITSLASASERIFDALEALQQQFGVETLLVVTRGNIQQQQFAKVHASRKTSHFLRNVIRIDSNHLAEKMEGYIVSGAADHGGLGGIPPSTVKMKQKEQIKVARDFILNALVDILRQEEMPEDQIPKSMNYKSYETKIVEQCGVVLVGYPGDKGIINPGELDALTLKELLSRLNDGRCHWEKVGEIDTDQRRRRSRSPAKSSINSNATTPYLSQSPSPGGYSHANSPSPNLSETLTSTWSPGASTLPGSPVSKDCDSLVTDIENSMDCETMMMCDPAQNPCEPPPYPKPDLSAPYDADPTRAMQLLLSNYRAFSDAFFSLLSSGYPLPFTPDARFTPSPFTSHNPVNNPQDLLSAFLSQPDFHQNAFSPISEANTVPWCSQTSDPTSLRNWGMPEDSFSNPPIHNIVPAQSLGHDQGLTPWDNFSADPSLSGGYNSDFFS